MSENLNQDPYQGLEQNPELVASEQVRLANEWAQVYANSDKDPDNSAEIILRNPTVYLDSVDKHSLPEDLQIGWSNADELAEQIVRVGETKPHEWGRDVTGISKLQNLVFTGEINPMLRGSVADLMRISAGLFSESVKHIPGNTSYFAGNIRGAVGWLKNR